MAMRLRARKRWLPHTVWVCGVFLAGVLIVLGAKASEHVSSQRKIIAQGSPPGGVRISMSIGNGYGSGVLAVSTLAEAEMSLESYGGSGTASIMLYRADEAALLRYLLHNDAGEQIHRDVSTESFTALGELKQLVVQGTSQRVALPLDEAGIYYVRATLENSKQEAFVVRAPVGLIVKEGEGKYVFWAQDYTTQRSLATGQVRGLSTSWNRPQEDFR